MAFLNAIGQAAKFTDLGVILSSCDILRANPLTTERLESAVASAADKVSAVAISGQRSAMSGLDDELAALRLCVRQILKLEQVKRDALFERA